MTTVATLSPPDLRLAPGTETRCTVTIHNRGEIVEGYHLEVLGDAANWATMKPPQVQVYPGTEATAEVLFRLPRNARVHAMDVPFAVRVLPMERPDRVVVPEGVLRIGELAELAGELLPQTSRTRRATVHDVAIDNLGNTPTLVGLTISDPDNALRIDPKPSRLPIGPGQAAVARVSVRHRKLLWRGQPIARRFQITAATPDGPGVALDGTSVQQPVLGRWMFAAAAALLALALVGAGLWFGLLRPAVKSQAEKAATEAAAAEADTRKASAEGPATAPGGAAPGGAASPSPAPSGSPGAGGAGTKPTVAAPVSLKVTINDARQGGRERVETLRSASPNRFVIQFINIGAPQGDTGLLQIFVGRAPWMIHNLANIRDYDTHPDIEVPPNQAVQVRVACAKSGELKASTNADSCFVNVVITGTEYRPAP